MLGATMIVGLRAACLDLRYSADEFFDAQHLFDIRVQSTLGLTQEDVDALADIDGVSVAEGGWSETVYTKVGSGSAKAEVRALSDAGMNEPLVLEGSLPAASDEIAVTKRFAKESGLSLGDTVTFYSEADSGQESGSEAASGTTGADEDADLEVNLDTDDSGTSTIVFKHKTYTISAVVLDPQDINAGEGSMSFRSSGGAQYAFFVTSDNVTTDVFTAVYLSVEGADASLCYSDEYERAVEAVKQRVEDAREERQRARGESVRADVAATIDDAEQTANEKIADGQTQIDDAKAELESGTAQLASGKQQLSLQQAMAEAQLQSAQEQITSGLAQLEQQLAQIEASEPQVDAGISQIDTGLAQLEQSRASAIDTACEQAEAAARSQVSSTFAQQREELQSQVAQLQDAIAPLAEAEAAGTISEDQTATLADLRTRLEQANAGLEQLSEEAEQAAADAASVQAREAATAQANEQLDAKKQELETQRASLAATREQLESGRATIAAARQQLEEGQAALDAQRATAQAQIQSGWATIVSSEAQLASGAADLEDAQATLDEQSRTAAEKIADARAQVDGIDDATWYVQDRSDLSSYASVESDASCIEVLGTVLPIVFFVVAVLISLTTMTRMVEEERGLIGLYKALGYGRGRILSKYVIYAATACLVGGLVGDVVGNVVLPAIIFTIFSTMYALPAFTYHLDIVYAVAAIVLFAAGIVGATVITCARELREPPASLMRPKAPKAGSRIILERIRPLWRRMSFLNKVTARNLMRYKRRFLMTVFGIAGCVTLLICGFGIRDTVLSLDSRQYGDAGINRYDLMAVTSADDLDAVAADLSARDDVAELMSLRIDSLTVSFGDSSESVTLFVVPDGCDLSAYVGLADGAGNALTPGKTGAIITKNAEQVLGFAAGDTVHAQDSTLAEADIQISGIAMNYLGNYLFMSESAYRACFGEEAEQNGVLVNLAGGDSEQIALADELSSDSRLLSVTSTAKLVRDFSSAFTLINTVVYVIIVLAAALSFTVVFTLSNTNISERERELATIKVLGFKRREVHVYINKETLILTGIGTLCGMPAGYLLTRGLTYVLKMPSLYFDTIVAWPSYVIAAVLAFAFTLAVNLMTNRSLDRVDMVGALKSAE